MGKLDRWLNRVQEEPPAPSVSTQQADPAKKAFPAEGKLDRWLARSEKKEDEPPASLQKAPPASLSSPTSPGASKNKVDRWLARTKGCDSKIWPAAVNIDTEEPKSTASKGPASPASGGVNACCNLLHLLDETELSQVFEVLSTVMSKKGIPGPASTAQMVPSIHIPPHASDAAKELASVLSEMTALAGEAKARTSKPSPSPSTPSSVSTAATSGGGKSKLDRWAARMKAPAPSPPPAQSGGNKLDRWAARMKTSPAASAPSTSPDAFVVILSPTETVKMCCEAVRLSWSGMDSSGGSGVNVAEERRKLQEEKKALDNLMQMVYAVRNTPVAVSGLTPPSTPILHLGGAGGSPPMWQSGQATQNTNGMNGANGMHGHPQMFGHPGGGGGGMNGYAPPPPQSKPDPDALLAEFLKARREEREQETKQLVNDKKNPRKVLEGKGWRAGSPMASATKPTEPVRIGLTRPPPQQQPQIMMMGPPPEGYQQHNGTREEVMSKEGGGGFFVYPPGHPNGPPGGPPPAGAMGQAAFEGQLRSTVHPMERIAPRWSEAKFKAQGMPEVICESRHATFGLLKEVQGRLVRCNPPDASKPIMNIDQVKGHIVYVKRGGCSFTRKARMAQAAGAVAMVVANSDRETFGMSFTDDGEPFEAIKIPCVMISSDVCEKLESCKSSGDGRAPWSAALTPMTDRASPAFQQHMQLQQLSAQNGGGPVHVQMLQEPQRGHGGSGSKGEGIMGRLKSMLP